MWNLKTLEFSECVIDSPEFREKLQHHEKAIDSSYKILKDIHVCVKNVFKTLEDCSKAFIELADVLKSYKSEQDKLLNSDESEDEKFIKAALSYYSDSLESIEQMRKEHILEATKDLMFNDIQNLKDECLAKCRQEIKEFRKSTSGYYQKLEKYASTKNKSDSDLVSIDTDMQQERKAYALKAMDHVMKIQTTQEEKTYRLVHTLSLFIQMLNTYHHHAWDHFCDQKKKMDDINCALFRTGENYKNILERTNLLKDDYLNMPIEHIQRTLDSSFTARREGYLFVQTKKSVMADSWTRSFCVYEKLSRKLTITPFNHANNVPGTREQQTEECILESCERRKSNSIDRRFCFDIKIINKQSTITLQALSKEDLNLWMSIMDGKEPVYAKPILNKKVETETFLNSRGHRFIHACIMEVEKRGLEEHGIYRTPGRISSIEKLMIRISSELRKTSSNADLISVKELEELDINTICSLIKAFLKNLREPLATFELYTEFINAGKQSDADKRFMGVKEVIKKLPQLNFQLLSLLMKHLKRVTQNQDVNLMTAPNLGVCFSPTIFRPEDSSTSLTSIRESKFAGDVISLLIERYEDFFHVGPDSTSSSIPPTAISASSSTIDSITRLTRLSATKSVYIPRLSSADQGDNSTESSANETKSRIQKSPLRRNRTDIKSSASAICSSNNNSSASQSNRPPPMLCPKPDYSKLRPATVYQNNDSSNVKKLKHFFEQKL